MTGTTTRRKRLSVGLAVMLAASMMAFLPGTAPAARAADQVLADFETGAPAGFFVYNGGASTVATGAALAVDFSITDFGGWGASFEAGGPQDWSATTGFGFWFYGTNSGLTYQAEISENRSDPTSDTSERWDYEFVDDFAGWRQISIPWGDFTRATDFQPPGAPDDGFAGTEIWAWAIVLPLGTDTVFFDGVALEGGGPVLADFETGAPDGFFAFAGASTVATDVVLAVDYSIGDFGGFGNSYQDIGGPQDWSATDGFGFWFYGTNSGFTYQAEISENRSDPTSDTSERWDYEFVDDTAGWRQISIPWGDFTRATDFQPPGAPDDGLTLTEVWAWGIVLPGGADTVFFDDVTLSAAPVVAPPSGPPKLADFETDPAGFFVFAGGSTVGTNRVTAADTDPLARPGQVGDNGILEVAYNVFDFGGFGAGFTDPQNWSTTDGFGFWFYGTNSGLTYQAEISENRSDPTSDTSERWDHAFVDDFAGWRHISIPWAGFTRATDFQPPGAPDDGFAGTEIWAWAIVLPLGTDTVYFDDVALQRRIVDGFESPLVLGAFDGDGVPVGFYTFAGPSTVAVVPSTSTSPPAPVPDQHPGNAVLALDVETPSYAGVIHGFETGAAPAYSWTPQDWSVYGGFALWLHGTGSGAPLFIDILENRNAGSTTDDAERWTVEFADDFVGWSYLEFPFDDFTRKPIGNGAPNDGFDRQEVNGWAFGVLATGGARTYYLDDVALYGIAEVPELAVSFARDNYEVPEGATGDVLVELNRSLLEGEGPVEVAFAIEPGTPVPGVEYTPVAGTLVFEFGGPDVQAFPFETFDDTKYEGDERVILRLSGPAGAGPGFLMQAAGTIVDDDPYDPLLLDDFERGAYQWDGDGVLTLGTEPAAGLPGQDVIEHVLAVGVAGPDQGYDALKREVIAELEELAAQASKKTAKRAQKAIDRIVKSLEEERWLNGYFLDEKKGKKVFDRERDAVKELGKIVEKGDVAEAEAAGAAIAALVRIDAGLARLAFEFAAGNGGDPDKLDKAMDEMAKAQLDLSRGKPDKAIDHFRKAWRHALKSVKKVDHLTLGTAGRDFAAAADWTNADDLAFWYRGTGSGADVTVVLKDNQAPDPGPAGWTLAWSDEFNDPAGTLPDPAKWGYEIGDGTINGIPGWGNAELQYYTDENAVTDGAGNLVVSAQEADGSLQCYYGACEYTSARLVSRHKAEFAYGRIESRIWVPTGPDGLWPAFWSLGTDIDRVGWPDTGEIDIMEYVSKIPTEVFGTIHGPGYFGGGSYGSTYNFPGGVAGSYHTFAIEWQPDFIEWFVDGISYHTAAPADVAPNEWVFNDPVYLLLNLAIGGNFGGALSPDLTFPQEMAVDYVRVFQAPDTAERFEATFPDDSTEWRRVSIPLSDFVRSADQPDGAPDDGLTLNEVWGYGFEIGYPAAGTHRFDQVRLTAPAEITVVNTDDAGPGSLRQAIAAVATGGTVTFDPALAGASIDLESGPLVVDGKTVTIDGGGAPGITVNGGGEDRVLVVEGGSAADVRHLGLTGGWAWQLAGCVLNNGSLTLDHVTVTDCVMDTDASNPDTDFWQGGGGIYNGAGASLHLTDSTVAGNQSGWLGGGIYSFFDTTTTIEGSTISGNTSSDVGGGLRTLGDVSMVNSTISGNTGTTWHGGAMFITDGAVEMVNVTVAGNTSGGAAIFVGTFSDASASLDLTNTILTGSNADGCFFAPWGSGTVAITSHGSNVVEDGSCFPSPTDVIDPDAGVGPLAGNGGPTATHALLVGSPAIDLVSGDCPAVDQRGVARPQGPACDAGSYELEP